MKTPSTRPPADSPLRANYDYGYGFGHRDARLHAIYSNPFDHGHTSTAIAMFDGYRDGFRQRCFELKLSFPTCVSLKPEPLWFDNL